MNLLNLWEGSTAACYSCNYTAQCHDNDKSICLNDTQQRNELLKQQQLNRQHCGYLLDVSTKQEIWIFGKERWQVNQTDDNSWISSITSCHQLSHHHHWQQWWSSTSRKSLYWELNEQGRQQHWVFKVCDEQRTSSCLSFRRDFSLESSVRRWTWRQRRRRRRRRTTSNQVGKL